MHFNTRQGHFTVKYLNFLSFINFIPEYLLSFPFWLPLFLYCFPSSTFHISKSFVLSLRRPSSLLVHLTAINSEIPAFISYLFLCNLHTFLLNNIYPCSLYPCIPSAPLIFCSSISLSFLLQRPLSLLGHLTAINNKLPPILSFLSQYIFCLFPPRGLHPPAWPLNSRLITRLSRSINLSAYLCWPLIDLPHLAGR